VISILAQSSGGSGGSSLISLALPLVMIVGLYFILIRPQRQRQRQQQSMQSALRVGDDVLISGGIYGTVTEIDDEADSVRVEIAPGTEVRMLRQGILQRLVQDDYDTSYESYEDETGTPDEGTDDRP
jgi:preprotein translocase subunit YajC